ncbi:Hypotetical protein [Plasmodium reichenowi]|uniref:Hypotetical protein n=1 Tax=Plasmodium reichenowi TaxID=5854 RepID=A0A2P9DRQ1_PLARE|nr:Hypotetical protein [Plasmodium reichenowi]
MDINVIIIFGVKNIYVEILNKVHDINQCVLLGFALSSTDVKNTLNFYKVVKDRKSIDEMKNYIYAFIKYYDKIKKMNYIMNIGKDLQKG